MSLASRGCNFSGVIFAGNSISIISIFSTAYIDIIDIISLFSKSSNHPRTLTIYYWNSRILQRVRLAHLRCNAQNMTSLVRHCTECTNTQYPPVCYGWLYIPLFYLWIQYGKLFWKVLKNFAKYREILLKVLRNNLKIFKRKIRKFR